MSIVSPEIKFRIVLGILCLSVFAAGVIWITYASNQKNLIYPKLEKRESIDDKIKSIEVERSYGRITFEGSLRRTIYFARNRAYFPSDFIDFSQKGDQLIKTGNDDTLRIVRNNQSYVFVLGKDIECCGSK